MITKLLHVKDYILLHARQRVCYVTASLLCGVGMQLWTQFMFADADTECTNLSIRAAVLCMLITLPRMQEAASPCRHGGRAQQQP